MRGIFILCFFIVSSYANEFYNDKELKVLRAIIDDDIKVYLRGGESSLNVTNYVNNLIRVDADTIQKEYEKNEVSADMKYQNKNIIVKGIVKQVRKDMFGNLVVDLKGGTNPYLPPSAQINKDYINWVSRLNKGEKIDIVCQNSKFVVSMVNLGKCSPYDAWSYDASVMFAQKANEFIKVNNQYFVKLKKVLSKIAPKLKANSSCFTSNDTSKCIDEAKKVLKTIPKK